MWQNIQKIQLRVREGVLIHWASSARCSITQTENLTAVRAPLELFCGLQWALEGKGQRMKTLPATWATMKGSLNLRVFSQQIHELDSGASHSSTAWRDGMHSEGQKAKLGISNICNIIALPSFGASFPEIQSKKGSAETSTGKGALRCQSNNHWTQFLLLYF